MAQDLRAVVGAIRMAGDLERIGDLAKNIAKRVSAVGESAPPQRFRTVSSNGRRLFWVKFDAVRRCTMLARDAACACASARR